MLERELLVALFNALGAYIKRTTGCSFIVCIKDSEGNLHHCYPDDSQVTWFNEQGEVVPPHVGPLGFADMHCPLHEACCGSQQEPQQVAEPSAIGLR